MRNPDGTAFDYPGTRYREDVETGIFDDWIYAIFGRIGGRWVCLDYGIGATDVGWLWYLIRYDAPESIYPEHGGEHDHH